MSHAELKAYTARAKELEAAIFTQEKLQKQHRKFIDGKCPSLPTKRSVAAPKRPERYQPHVEEGNMQGMWVIILVTFIVGSLIMFCLPLSDNYIGGPNDGVTLGLLFALPTILPISKLTKYKKIENEINGEREADYQAAMKAYNQAMATLEANQEKAKTDYAQAMTTYHDKLNEYNTMKAEMVSRHEEAYDSLVNALDVHYAQNVIYPKYRNFVAITMINEYLESGRCDALEGPGGAYNLYEMELRQNIIIGQLSSIVSNLEQIRSNQYSLYQEITTSNAILKEIMFDIKSLNSEMKLNNYLSKITALCALDVSMTI